MNPTPYANTILPISAALIAGIAAKTYLAKPLRYMKYNNIKTISQIRKLKPKHFEEYVLFSFLKLGYDAVTTSRNVDGDIDVTLTKNGKTHTVRCNAWSGTKIPIEEVRDFFESTGYTIASRVYILDGEMPYYATA